MAVERTLSIIKPDAVEQNHIGEIVAMIEAAGLKVKAMRMTHLSRPQAEGFYYVHKERPFFGELVEFMTRGPVVLMCLEGEGAIAKWREVMGATNPAEAAEGTVRKRFGSNIGENASHGSDATETAAFEVSYFFPGYDL
ncbi:MAG: nucleoside-diphosphate kinase [Myxococcales bacterium]|nr:nucleoside-diphosphate kinase [Myxococcales bacterium]